MFQPFEEFKTSFIPRLLALNRIYLVTQSYNRAPAFWNGRTKISLLLTDYDDRGGANIHRNAIRQDPYAAVIDLSLPMHKDKLEEMLQAHSPYQLYWSVVKSRKQVEAQINRRYKDNMRRFVERHTHWRIDQDAGVSPKIDVSFGEVFLTLKQGRQTIRVKFEDIENS